MTTFAMECPVCDDEIEDIEGAYIEARGREEFWGQPVTTDESEFEVETIPPCPSCGRVTLTPEQVAEHFWDVEAFA